MTKDNSSHVARDDTEEANDVSKPGGRRPYTTPQLDAYGHIQALTLGGSAGVGESGSPSSKSPLSAPSALSTRPTPPARPRNPARK